MRALLARLLDRLRRDQLDTELREELAFHQRMLERDGSPNAQRQLGHSTLHREHARDLWSLGWLDIIVADVRYALRGLRRAPGFTLVVTLTLGLGIGANVAILDVTDRLMFRPLPYLHDPSTVNRVYLQTTSRARTNTAATYPYTRYLDIAHAATSISRAAAITEWPLAVGEGDGAVERQVIGADATLFEFFDGAPALGRYFTTDENAIPRGADVVVLGYEYWMNAFAGRNVLGERLRVGPLVLTVIGVAPKGFVGISEGEPPVAFVPITTLAYGVNQGDAQTFAQRYNWDWSSMIVRRKQGVTLAQENADLTAAFILSRERQRASMPNLAATNIAHPVAIAGSVRVAAGPSAGLESRTLLWVNGVALIVLLIACANVLNLLLARVVARRREIAVRLSLGVSRRRLASQFIVEGALLATLGCVAGVVIAESVWSSLHALIVRDNVQTSLIADWRALAIACGAAFVAAIVISLAPALVAPRDDVAATLRAGTRGGGDTTTSSRLRATLLVFQGALSAMLLIGAGLFVRSLNNARTLNLGWDPRPVLVAVPNYRGLQLDTATMTRVRQELLDAAHSVSGVLAVTRVNSMPFATNMQLLFVEGIDSVARLGRFDYQATTPEYFNVVGTRIVRGRAFKSAERGEAGLVAVVSQSMARTLWPGVDPIGRCFRISSRTAPCTTVIGVAEDAVQNNIGDAKPLLYYLPDDAPGRSPGRRLWARVATDDPDASSEALRRALQRAMPAPGYVTVTRLEDVVDAQRRSWTLGATMFVAFGALALVVAAVGLYGVIAYSVTQRMHELAVRSALGAQRADIVQLVVKQALSFAAAGVVVGEGVTLLVARWIEPLLFRESVRDPVVFIGVAGVVCLVSLVASTSPSLRAVRANPTDALRAA
ncbi:MAG TPA: ABC transporter permease [Gemmatimonadaceae bacterium]|jgi:predicted permease